MQRRTNIQVSTIIILLGILTVLLQFAVYYFFEPNFVIWGISALLCVICCHVLLEQTTSYEACSNYSLLTLFVSVVIIVITYFGNIQSFLPYTTAMLGIAVINWLIPLIHCQLRHMLNYGIAVDDFNIFYRNMSILFLIFYFIIILVGSFVKDSFPWAYPVESNTYNLVPFNIIATQIEDFLNGYIPLSEIMLYLTIRILVFVPYGYYITLVLRHQTKLPRFFALLILPLLIEILQYFFLPEYCDIDDLIYAIIGGILGSLLYHLNAVIFHAVSGKEFLSKENDYRFGGSSLYY